MIKKLATTAASVLIFAMTFALLFMRSQSVFKQLLTAKVSHVSLSDVEEAQFVYWSFRTSEISKMIKDLAEEREALQTKAEKISIEQARVDSERTENERLRNEITRLRKELSDYIIEIKQGESARLREEAAILNSMAPENVVTVFNEKSDDAVVKILYTMKPDVIAPILELMMNQPQVDTTAPPPEKRVVMLLEKLKRLREAKK